MTQDFSKGKIYKITNDFNNEVYVGSTCDSLIKRFSTHKKGMYSNEKKHRPLYSLMNDIGFNRFKIELIENYPCDDKYSLRQREGYWIRNIGTLNVRIESRSIKEYVEDNKELIYNIKKKSAEKHKDENMLRKKEWYEKNKERILMESKKIVICECGCKVVKGVLNRHIKTKKHQSLLDNNNSLVNPFKNLLLPPLQSIINEP